MHKMDIIYSKNRAKRNGCGCPALHYFSIHSSLFTKKGCQGAPSIKMCRSKSPLFRYNCRKNCQLASAKLTVFYFILTKNRLILSATQFLLSYFIRISEKKDFAYLPYSLAFLSLRRMKERRKNRHLFIEGAPKPDFFMLASVLTFSLHRLYPFLWEPGRAGLPPLKCGLRVHQNLFLPTVQSEREYPFSH